MASTEDISELTKLSVFNETLGLQELHARVIRVTKKKQPRSLEQKIIALKILILNNMRYDLTENETGVTRKTLWTWWKEYGPMMKATVPSRQIAQELEDNRAGLINDVYENSRVIAKKIRELAEKTTDIRQLKAINESFKNYTEYLLKAEGQTGGGDGQVNNFYTNINEMMVQNQIKPNGDKN